MKLGLALVLVAAVAADAGANGRPAGTSTIHFRQGHEQDIAAGLTFGLAISHDGGTTWEWMCEAAVGYGGLYDPDYAYSSSGALFATTFNGFKVERDSCTFAATPPGMTFISQDELGPDGALYIAAADKMDSSVSKSTDDGMNFPTSATPGIINDWWESLLIAPGDANLVFLGGYRYIMKCDVNSVTPGSTCTVPADCQDATHQNGMCANQKQLLVFKSVNGGTSYTPLPGNLANDGASSSANAGLMTSSNSTLDLVGVSQDGGTLYAKVSFETANVASDGLYKLDVAGSGTTWTRIQGTADTMAVVVRHDDSIVYITKTVGGGVSTNAGASWTPLTNPPHANCIVENPADHTVWACTQNYGSPVVPSDGYGIMKTADLASWTGVLKYQDLTKPVTCAAGTPQHDTCEAMTWCGLKQQLGITSDAVSCPALVDGPVDAGSAVKTKPKPCGCTTGDGGATTALAGSAAFATLLLRRRRRKLR